jgi:hypothetical protein
MKAMPDPMKLIKVRCSPGLMPHTWSEEEFCRLDEDYRKNIVKYWKAIIETTAALEKGGWKLVDYHSEAGEDIRYFNKFGRDGIRLIAIFGEEPFKE